MLSYMPVGEERVVNLALKPSHQNLAKEIKNTLVFFGVPKPQYGSRKNTLFAAVLHKIQYNDIIMPSLCTFSTSRRKSNDVKINYTVFPSKS